jgi:hypothetical protein
MPHQQHKYLQLVQGLAPHRPLLILWTYHTVIVGVNHVAAEGDVETARPYKPRELNCQGTRPLQTQEPFPPVVVSVLVVGPFWPPPPPPPAVPARFRFSIINYPNLSCPGMGSYIATATNEDDDEDKDDKADTGLAAMRRSRSCANVSGRYIKKHSRTRSVGNDSSYPCPGRTSFRNKESGEDHRSSVPHRATMIRLLCLCHRSIFVQVAFSVVVVNPPSPRSDDDRIQRVAVGLAVFVAAFFAISFRPDAVTVVPVRDAPRQPYARLLLVIDGWSNPNHRTSSSSPALPSFLPNRYLR